MKRINLNDVPWVERKSPKGRFHKFRRSIARAFENPKTGPKLPSLPPFEVELVRMPPGTANYPFHSHAAEWEFYLIISGSGKIRAGKMTRNLKPGDCILSPPNEPHQIVNSGKEELVYYVIANNSPVDIWHYPESNKWGWPHKGGEIFRKTDAEYFDGEE